LLGCQQYQRACAAGIEADLHPDPAPICSRVSTAPLNAAAPRIDRALRSALLKKHCFKVVAVVEHRAVAVYLAQRVALQTVR
jgi:hypothetical protein